MADATTTRATQTDLERVALDYAAHGWHVLPVRPAGKVPLTTHGVHDASAASSTITAWWCRLHDAGVAIATGAGSGLIVIDVDPRHGGDDTLRDLEFRYGALPDTPRVL